jgi:hypothetical protein
VDSQPKTQRSSREKTKCKYTVSNLNYSTGLGWKWGKYIESSPFYRGNLGFPLSFPPHGRATCVHARSHRRAVTGPRGRDFYRADAVFTASACKTASAGKRGRARTSGQKGRPDGHFHPKTSFMTSLAEPTSIKVEKAGGEAGAGECSTHLEGGRGTGYLK